MKTGLVKKFTPLLLTRPHATTAAGDDKSQAMPGAATSPGSPSLEEATSSQLTRCLLKSMARYLCRVLLHNGHGESTSTVGKALAQVRKLARLPIFYRQFMRASLSFLAALSSGIINYALDSAVLTLETHLAADLIPAVFTSIFSSATKRTFQLESIDFLAGFLCDALIFTMLCRGVANDRVHLVKTIHVLIDQVLLTIVDGASAVEQVRARLKPSLFNDARTQCNFLSTAAWVTVGACPFDGSVCDFFETSQRRLDFSTSPQRFGGFQHPGSLPLCHDLPNLHDAPVLPPRQAQGSRGTTEHGSSDGSGVTDFVASGQERVRKLTEGKPANLLKIKQFLPLCVMSAIARKQHLKNTDRWILSMLTMDLGDYDIEDVPPLFEAIQGGPLERRHRSHIVSKAKEQQTTARDNLNNNFLPLATHKCKTVQTKPLYRATEETRFCCPYAEQNHVSDGDLRALLIAQNAGLSLEAIQGIAEVAARGDPGAACLAHYNALLRVDDPRRQERPPTQLIPSPPLFVFNQVLKRK